MTPIRHLILDLGGVIFEINVPNAVKSFAALRGGKPEDIEFVEDQMRHKEIWNDLERGKTTPDTFRAQLRDALQVEATDEELDHAWNSLCVGPILEYIPLLHQLAQSYDLVLLSNTNGIHWKHLYESAKALFEPFQHLFLSFEMGSRKPEKNIFEQTLAWKNWSPSECLFFDDTPANLATAAEIGIQTQYVEQIDNADFGIVVQKNQLIELPDGDIGA